MSRTEAKDKISLEDFRSEMKDVYSSSVCKSTIDESPMAYKPMEAITGKGEKPTPSGVGKK
jgi:tRNA-splicing ligase RtcB